MPAKSSVHRDEVVSRAIFGSEKRLSILAAVAQADDDGCFPSRIADEAGAAQGPTSDLMSRLVEVGLLQVLPAERGNTLKRHRKVPSALWSLAPRLLDELRSAQPKRP